MGFDLAGDVVGTGLRKGDAALLRARDDAHLRHDVERLAHVMARDAEAVRKARFRVGLMTRTGAFKKMTVNRAEEDFFVHGGCPE